MTGIKSRAVSIFKNVSLPFPEPGLRLIRQDDIASVNMQMTTLKAELQEAVEELNRHYDELKAAARERLGNLYNESDYPSTLIGLFDMAWEFPSRRTAGLSSTTLAGTLPPGMRADAGPIQ